MDWISIDIRPGQISRPSLHAREPQEAAAPAQRGEDAAQDRLPRRRGHVSVLCNNGYSPGIACFFGDAEYINFEPADIAPGRHVQR